jgi:hypothetical protein
MGIQCSCFHSDFTAGSVEISEKLTVLPFTYEPAESLDDHRELKSLGRRHLELKSLAQIASPDSRFERTDLPIHAFQSPAITQLEKTLEPFRVQISGPVYLINNEYYSGQFNKKCEKHGNGMLITLSNQKYVGGFKKDKMEGLGRMYFENEDVYEGEFRNNKAHGKGKYMQANGSVYVGDFKKDKQHGMGNEVWSNGSVYTGEYKHGQKHGKGKLVYPNNTCYVGDFCENRIEGTGIYRWSEQKWYEGQFVDSKMHGIGELHSQSGLVYKGEFKDDLKDGLGICWWPDGRVYEGMWKEGSQHGEGVFTFVGNDGGTEKKKGMWNRGKREYWINQ